MSAKKLNNNKPLTQTRQRLHPHHVPVICCCGRCRQGGGTAGETQSTGVRQELESRRRGCVRYLGGYAEKWHSNRTINHLPGSNHGNIPMIQRLSCTLTSSSDPNPHPFRQSSLISGDDINGKGVIGWGGYSKEEDDLT